MFSNIFQKYLTAKNIIFFIAVILFIRFVFKVQDIVLMFFASYVIASSLNPIADKICEKFSNINKNVSSVLVLLGGILLAGLFVIPIVIITGQEVGHFANTFPEHLNSIKNSIETLPLMNASTMNKLDVNNIFNSASGTASQVLGNLFDACKNIGSGFVYLITTIILIYYFMVDKKVLNNAFLKLFPHNLRAKANSIMETITQKIGGYVIAQIATMASVGLIMTIGLLILHVNYAIILGLITAVLDIIPIVGPALALVICLVVCSESSPLILGLIIVVFAIAQLSENTFVRPLLFGKMLNLHPVIIYLFLFLSAKYLGVVGVIFAPAIAATTLVLIDELYIKNLE